VVLLGHVTLHVVQVAEKSQYKYLLVLTRISQNSIFGNEARQD
jgi:hypothetical protein